MIGGRTTVAALIGDPVHHSLSPRIHNAAFAATGLDWVYVALPVVAGNGAAAARRSALCPSKRSPVTLAAAPR